MRREKIILPIVLFGALLLNIAIGVTAKDWHGVAGWFLALWFAVMAVGEEREKETKPLSSRG